jgi:hypothetical protein
MQEPKCRECGQSFKTPAEHEEHVERVHGIGEKVGQSLTPDPPNEARRR